MIVILPEDLIAEDDQQGDPRYQQHRYDRYHNGRDRLFLLATGCIFIIVAIILILILLIGRKAVAVGLAVDPLFIRAVLGTGFQHRTPYRRDIDPVAHARLTYQRDQLRHILTAILFEYRETVHQYRLQRGRDRNTQLGRRLKRILMDTVKPILGHDPGDTAIDGRAHSVDVRPRSLIAVFSVLLLRGVTLLEHDRHLFFFVGKMSRGAEVHQLEASVPEIHDIIRADIAMDNPRRVDLFKRAHHRQHQVKDLIDSHRAVGVQILIEIDTVKILHDDIRRTVRLKIIANVNDTLFAGEHRDAARLNQKPLFSLFKERALFIGAEGQRAFLVAVAIGIPGGIEFLDRDAHIQRGIAADIGDAEAALADRVANQIFMVENRTGAQMMRRTQAVVFLMTIRTDSRRSLLVHAVITIHTVLHLDRVHLPGYAEKTVCYPIVI